MTEFFSAISVVSILTFSFNEVGLFAIAAIVNCLGSSLSNLRQQVLIQKSTVEVEVREASVLWVSCFSVSMSFVFSTYKTSKQLWDDNEGMLFIHCLGENPGVRFLPPQ